MCSSARKALPLQNDAALRFHAKRYHSTLKADVGSNCSESLRNNHNEEENVIVGADLSRDERCHHAANCSDEGIYVRNDADNNLNEFNTSMPMMLYSYGIIGAITFGIYRSTVSCSFFKHQHDNNLGAAALVSNSQFEVTTAADHIPSSEVDMHMHIASLVSSLTRKQREDLATVLYEAVNTTIARQGVSSLGNNPEWRTKIPTCMKEIRNFYVRGKNAILPNLPKPSVTVISNHAYVSLKDCVADILGHGLDLDIIMSDDQINYVSLLSECQVAQEIYENSTKNETFSCKPLCLYITEWSDAFEPSSCTKNNRGSCWIKTVTISPTVLELHNMTYTYPIAIGKDGDDHSTVEQLFANELQEFREGIAVPFYYGKIKRNVFVYLEVLASLQDQPERRKSSCIMLGGSKYSSRWGYSMDLNHVSKYVPACISCFHNLMHNITADTCERCVNWNTDDVTHELMKFPAPPNFPADEVPIGNLLSPIKLSYSILAGAVTKTHNKFLRGEWCKKNMESYLRIHGINTKSIHGIMECAVNAKVLQDIRLNDPVALRQEVQVMNDYAQYPERFSMWKLPPSWTRGVPISRHIDVCMHLIFLGVVKTVIGMVQDWVKHRGKTNCFMTYMTGTLEGIQLLGIDWCRTLPYGSGKLGGWVSENYVAIARLLSWIYGGLAEVIPDSTFDSPNKEQHKWTLRENQQWLSVRGLDNSGNAKTVRDRVKNYRNQPNGAPEVLQPRGGTAKNVCNMTHALKAMVARVMQEEVGEEDILDAKRHIKIFLSCFDTFDKEMRGENDKPTWITSYNFICLTNLPDVMQHYGPVRNLWEGGGQGEKIIRLFKPVWYGFRKNWHYNLLNNVLQQMSINRVQVMREKKKVNNNCNMWGINTGKKMIHKYKNMEDVHLQYYARKPISMLKLNNGKFYIGLRDGCLLEIILVIPGTFIHGSCYHEWIITNAPVHYVSLAQQQVSDICLLLPKLNLDGIATRDSEPIYTAVNAEWADIQSDGTFALPKVEHSITF
jgi:hypothetical protein